MNINKRYISCNCTNKECPNFKNCCMLPTEIVTHDDYDKVDILFVGQGAGANEEKLKRPFVGRAGKYLRNVILYIWNNYGEYNIALSNNVRFRPYDIVKDKKKNREPNKDEIDICINHLYEDILALNPKVIIPLGKNATNSLINNVEKLSMAELRNPAVVNIKDKDRLIYPTYHPSFLCRNYSNFKPELKNDYDLKVLTDIVNGLNSTLSDKIPEIF